MAGKIEVITGCMFSGKTTELARRVERVVIARRKVEAFKPIVDNRYSKKDIVAHNGHTITAHAVKDSANISFILQHENKPQVVAIDEAQFFDLELPTLVETLAIQGIDVILAGLDKDFRGEPFGPMSLLLTIADRVDKLSAICMVCGSEAYYTQRLVNGKPAHYDDPIIVVGAQEQYEARCRDHHEVLLEIRQENHAVH